jgi:hypothetical protein
MNEVEEGVGQGKGGTGIAKKALSIVSGGFQ